MKNYYFEGSPIAAPLTISSNEPVFVSESISLGQTRRSQGSQRWELTFSVQPLGEQTPLVFLNSVRSGSTVGEMVMPQLLHVEENLSTDGSGLKLSVDAAANASEVNVYCPSCFLSGNNIFLPAGAFINFAGHSKLYVITAKYDSSSDTSLEIFPSLRKEVLAGTEVFYPGYSGPEPSLKYWRSNSEIKGVTYEDGVLASLFKLNLLEDV